MIHSVLSDVLNQMWTIKLKNGELYILEGISTEVATFLKVKKHTRILLKIPRLQPRGPSGP